VVGRSGEEQVETGIVKGGIPLDFNFVVDHDRDRFVKWDFNFDMDGCSEGVLHIDAKALNGSRKHHKKFRFNSNIRRGGSSFHVETSGKERIPFPARVRVYFHILERSNSTGVGGIKCHKPENWQDDRCKTGDIQLSKGWLFGSQCVPKQSGNGCV
jgi:hypothetical protein